MRVPAWSLRVTAVIGALLAIDVCNGVSRGEARSDETSLTNFACDGRPAAYRRVLLMAAHTRLGVQGMSMSTMPWAW